MLLISTLESTVAVDSLVRLWRCGLESGWKNWLDHQVQSVVNHLKPKQ